MLPLLLHQTCIAIPAQAKTWPELEKQGWSFKRWDLSQQKALFQEHYHWFLNTWIGLASDHDRCLVSAYFILHHEGGVFLQQGWHINTTGFLALLNLHQRAELSLLFQDGYYKPIFMVSRPKHGFWEEVFKALQQEQPRYSWQTTLDHQFYTLGPGMLTQVVKAYGEARISPVAEAYFSTLERYENSRVFTYQAAEAPPQSHFQRFQREMSQFNDTSGWILVSLVMAFAFLSVVLFFLWLSARKGPVHKDLSEEEEEEEEAKEKKTSHAYEHKFRPKGLSRFIA